MQLGVPVVGIPIGPGGGHGFIVGEEVLEDQTSADTTPAVQGVPLEVTDDYGVRQSTIVPPPRLGIFRPVRQYPTAARKLVGWSICWVVCYTFPVIVCEYVYGLRHLTDSIPDVSCNSQGGVGPSKWLIIDASISSTSFVLLCLYWFMAICLDLTNHRLRPFVVCVLTLMGIVSLIKFAWGIYGAVVLSKAGKCKDFPETKDLYNTFLSAVVLSFTVTCVACGSRNYWSRSE